MTKPIPVKQRLEMSEDPFYKECCISDTSCRGVIQWHHNLIFAGKRQNVGILPVCEAHHRRESEFKDSLDRVMLNRMSDTELQMYSKAENLTTKRDRLNR